MVVKHCLLHYGRNAGQGYLKTGYHEANIWAQEGEIEKWRRLENEELRRLYRSPNIVKVIKSRRLEWAGYVVRLLGRPMLRRWDDITMDRKQIDVRQCIRLIRLRLEIIGKPL